MRKVTVFSMLDNSNVAVESQNIRTWGDVLKDQRVRNIVSGDMKIVIKQTKVTIDSEESVLPEGDITIYLFPGKVKAGKKDEGFNYTKSMLKLVDDAMEAFEEALKKDVDHIEKEFTAQPGYTPPSFTPSGTTWF